MLYNSSILRKKVSENGLGNMSKNWFMGMEFVKPFQNVVVAHNMC